MAEALRAPPGPCGHAVEQASVSLRKAIEPPIEGSNPQPVRRADCRPGRASSRVRSSSASGVGNGLAPVIRADVSPTAESSGTAPAEPRRPRR